MSGGLVDGVSRVLLQKHARDGFNIATFKTIRECLEQLMHETYLEFPCTREGYAAHVQYLTEAVARVREYHDRNLDSPGLHPEEHPDV